MTPDDIKLYTQQFDNLNRLVGKSINEIVFYIEATDTEFTEQPNTFGKSLFNGIDINVKNTYLSIGCRFVDSHRGLTISEGRTTEFEFIEEEKSPIAFDTKIIGQTIKSIDIYWMKIPWDGAVGYYPQEFVIKTETDFFLISSILFKFSLDAITAISNGLPSFVSPYFSSFICSGTVFAAASK